MAEQLFNQAFRNILPSSHISLSPALLMSTFFLAVSPPIVVINPPITKDLKTEYDFIVVGSGSAGAVVAGRLSENPEFEVLLLEAGGKATKQSEIPAFLGTLQRTELDWNFTIGPSSEYCLGMIDKTCFYARGKVLGGSSTLNHGAYVRGNKKDYDGWANMGNYGWSFEDVLPFFKKSEDNQNIELAKNRRFHSTGGPLTIHDLRWTTPLADAFLEAGVELGYSTGDYNAEDQTVFAIFQYANRDGFRCSTNKAFLVPAGERENFDVAIHAHVTKVLIDPKTNRAYGVRFFQNGAYHNVLARKEVILSAGVINTPQILMLSGIGPKDHLKDLKIPLIKELFVGFNLNDQVGYPLIFVTDKPVTYLPQRYNNLITNMTFDIFQKGPLTNPGADIIGFLNSKYQDPKESFPDITIILLPSTAATDGGFGRKLFNLGDELYNALYSPIEDLESFQIYVGLTRPKSVGRILMKSKNPLEHPDIRINYLSDKDDIRRLIDGSRLIIELAETTAFKNLSIKYHYAPIPLCPNALPFSDEYFECLIRYNTQPFLHATGTCKMGPVNDTTAVVDPELRVHGITGLRVADASIMPTQVSGYTHAPSVMIGEKAADLIKKFWKNKLLHYK